MPLTSYSAPTRPRRNCSCPATKKPKCSTGATCPAADGHWVIEQRGNTIYVQDPYPINVVFDGTDGKTKKRYRIDVVFEPDLARVTLDGTVFDLTQYVTADGFGYKNDMMDLRGKGREATLTMRDGLILSLTERK